MKQSYRLLVVDDEPDMVETCRKILERRGYRVVTALSGSKALEALQQGHFDLVLADLRLPDLDGLEVLRAAKRRDPDIMNFQILQKCLFLQQKPPKELQYKQSLN